MDTVDLYKKIVNGDRVALSRAITLLESSKPSHVEVADQILAKCHSENIIPRIALTGPPGVGKSSMIEALGLHWIREGQQLAVLTVDPSSTRTGGSILGDQTRMESLSKEPNAYIRQSPSSAQLGGIAPKTHEALLLCEQAPFDHIIIETIGVGQSELEVSKWADITVLLAQPGSGDELQGVKKGVLEMADIIVVNKADGAYKTKAETTARQLKTALHLLPETRRNGRRKVLLASAMENLGIQTLSDYLSELYEKDFAEGWTQRRRKNQNTLWADQLVREAWMKKLIQHPSYQNRMRTFGTLRTPKDVLSWVKKMMDEV